MGGAGERFASDTPKQFHRLLGKKVYLHTLEAFLKSDLFEEILLVTATEWIEEVRREIPASPKITLIEGGKTRQESSFKGLLACGADTRVVVIHDAVRPFVSQQILFQNVQGALAFHAVDTCIPSADTLVFAPEKETIASIPPREHFLRGQTPQSFSYPLILKAHLHAEMQNSSDDCSLVLALGHPVHVVEGSEANIKITTPLDLILAEQISRLHLHSLSSSPPLHSLKNKRFAITGGTGGIGSAVAHLLQEEGAETILLSKSSSHFPIDLTNSSATKDAFCKIGPLDGLINCIGLLKLQEFHSLTEEEIDLLIATNLTSVLYSCKAAQLKEGAHIVNLASSSYTRGRKKLRPLLWSESRHRQLHPSPCRRDASVPYQHHRSSANRNRDAQEQLPR